MNLFLAVYYYLSALCYWQTILTKKTFTQLKYKKEYIKIQPVLVYCLYSLSLCCSHCANSPCQNNFHFCIHHPVCCSKNVKGTELQRLSDIFNEVSLKHIHGGKMWNKHVKIIPGCCPAPSCGVQSMLTLGTFFFLYGLQLCLLFLRIFVFQMHSVKSQTKQDQTELVLQEAKN